MKNTGHGPPGTRPKVIAYCRVSTEEQAASGHSLAAQRHRLAGYAEAHALDLVAVEGDEGISAKRTSNRPGLQRALAALARGEADGLAVARLDRLSRSTRDVLDLVALAERGGWALHSIEERLDTGSPHGRFVVTVLAALAQMEREQAGARTRTSMAEMRRRGRRVSGVAPFGYRFEGDAVVEVAAEREVLSRMLALADEGAGPFRIASRLNREGVANPRTGRAWYAGTVRSIVATARRRSAG